MALNSVFIDMKIKKAKTIKTAMKIKWKSRVKNYKRVKFLLA